MVERFNAEVWVTRGSETVGGTSIMGLMMLAAGPGTSIVVSAAGPEARSGAERDRRTGRRQIPRRKYVNRRVAAKTQAVVFPPAIFQATRCGSSSVFDGPERPWKNRCVVMTRFSAPAALAAIQASQVLHPVIRGIADPDEAALPGLFERGQSRRPAFAGCIRLGMIWDCRTSSARRSRSCRQPPARAIQSAHARPG